MARELEKLDLSFIDWPRLQRAAARSDLRMLDAKSGLIPNPLVPTRTASGPGRG
jgi:hypothetical protein